MISCKLKETLATKAALEAELSTLKLRQAIETEQIQLKAKHEESKLRLKQKERELVLSTKFAKIKAQERIYSAETQSSVSRGKSSRSQSNVSRLLISPQQPPIDNQSQSFVKPQETGLSIKSHTDESPNGDKIKSTSTPKGGASFGAKKLSPPPSQVNCSTLDPTVAEWEPTNQQIASEKSTGKESLTSSEQASQHETAVSRMVDLQQLQQQQNQQVQTLLKQQREQTVALTLPRPDLPVFSGDPIEYCNFIRSFENLIEAKTSSSSSRLFYLIQYTGDDVKELMRSCLPMSPDEGYQTARQLLKKKYGQNYRIASAYIDKVINTPSIKAEDGQALQRFSVMLTSCKNALKEVGFLNKIENPDSLQKIVEKLPYNLRQRMRDVADQISEVQNREVTIADIADFIERKSRAANHPIFGNISNDAKKPYAVKGTPPSFTKRAKTYSTQGEASQAPSDSKPPQSHMKCVLCSGDHWITRCDIFKGKSVRERLRFTREKNICGNCLMRGHWARECAKESFCKVPGCKLTQLKHSTFLHPKDDGFPPNNDKLSFERTTNHSAGEENRAASKANCISVADNLCTATGAGTMRTGLAIVPVKVRAKGTEDAIQVYAFLDSGSNTTFCTERLADRLGVTGKGKMLSLTTMDNDNIVSKSRVVRLEVCDLHGLNVVELPNVFTRTKLPVAKDDIPCQADLDRWPHLHGIPLPSIDAEVELLIGNDVPRLLEPKDVRASCNGGPYAVKTLLGWTINGPLEKTDNLIRKANRIHADVDLNYQFESFCNREFNDSHNDIKKGMSQEDNRAMSMIEEMAQLREGHYEIALPWRDYPPMLPNNKILAERRLDLLKKRLTKDQELHRKYSEFMNTLLAKGYAQSVPEDQLRCTLGNTCVVSTSPSSGSSTQAR